VIVTSLLSACDYSPAGSHFEEIDPNPEVIADISLNQQQDTVVAQGNLSFVFNVSLLGHSVYGYQLKLDKSILAEERSLAGSYFFQSKKYKDGYHELQLLIVANSGTGSLADKSGAEIVEVYRTWTVYVDNGPPSAVAVTSVKPEDGQLKIEWQPYKRPGFQKFELVKTLNGIRQDPVATFTDPSATSWIDDSYVGGPVSYYVVAYANGYYNGTYGPTGEYEYPLPRILHTTYNEAKDLTVTFSATPFYKNFKAYELHASQGLSFQSSERTDTTVTFPDPGFGSDFAVKLIAYPKGTDPELYARHMYSQSTIEGYGTAWGPCPVQNLLRRPQVDRFYSFQQDYIKVVDPSSLQVVTARDIVGQQYQELGYNKNVVSQDGRYLYAMLDGKLHRLSPSTLQTQERFEFVDVLPKGGALFQDDPGRGQQ